jgi:hypothetical protein
MNTNLAQHTPHCSSIKKTTYTENQDVTAQSYASVSSGQIAQTASNLPFLD